MNNGMYGQPSPPNFATRFAPPVWRTFQTYTSPGTYSGLVVPANVFQVLVAVFGGGGSGAIQPNTAYGFLATGGGGGGFASGIINVIPGQILPTITVGAGGTAATMTVATTIGYANGNAGGTSSFGSFLTATGGSGGIYDINTLTTIAGGAGGTGVGVSTVRNLVTASGGAGGTIFAGAINRVSRTATGGGAAGSFWGNGGAGGSITNVFTPFGYCATGGGGLRGGNGGSVNLTGSSDITGGNIATGGGGFGNSGGNITYASVIFNTSQYAASGGGGSASAGKNGVMNDTIGAVYTNGGNGILGLGGTSTSAGTALIPNLPLNSTSALPYSFYDILFSQSVFVGGGGAGFSSSSPLANLALNGSYGGGSGGYANSNVTNVSGGLGGGGGGLGGSVSSSSSSLGFGGTGGVLSSTSGLTAGLTTFGGGTGGMLCGSSVINSNAPGGHGLVFIAWTEGY